MSERRPVETDELHRDEWIKPVVRRMDAGDAESGFGGTQTDVAYATSS